MAQSVGLLNPLALSQIGGAYGVYAPPRDLQVYPEAVSIISSPVHTL